MAISDKEAALRIIEQLPDDASLRDFIEALRQAAAMHDLSKQSDAFQSLSRTVRELPDNASWEEILEALVRLAPSSGRNGASATSLTPGASFDEVHDGDDAPVSYHLEREGWTTVLVPDRPVPPLTAEMVNEVIQEIRSERVDCWLGLTDESGGKDGWRCSLRIPVAWWQSWS